MKLTSKRMRSQTALISVIAGCLSATIVRGQVSHHNPVIHHGSAKSFQSFTYFGHKSYPATQAFLESTQEKSTLKYTPLTTKAPYVAPTYRSLAIPARYNPVAARATFAPYRPAPVPKQASTTVAPLITTFSTTAFVPTALRTDIPASEIVDAALEDIKKEGPKLVKVVAKIQTNRLIKRLFSTDDSCNVFPENIAEVLEKLNEAAISSRSDLINIIAASQEMKKNENNTQLVLLEASNALLAINPLLPIFREIFPTNEGCDSNIKASVVGFNQIGSLLEVLGTTNLVSDNDVTKLKITKGGQTTKILADLVKKLEEGGFTTLCEGSSTFSSDVLLGVSELLKAFEKIAVAFDAKSELSDLGKTVAVIRDGAVSIFFTLLKFKEIYIK